MTQTEYKSAEWLSVDGKLCYKINFPQHLKHDDAKIIAQQWTKTFKVNPANKYTVIFDCLYMENYDPLARTTWQKTIGELKGQIEKIYVVTNSNFISAGANIMGVFTKFNIKVVKSIDQIKVNL